MKSLKIRYWFEKHKKIIILLLIVAVLAIVIWSGIKVDISFIVERYEEIDDPTGPRIIQPEKPKIIV